MIMTEDMYPPFPFADMIEKDGKKYIKFHNGHYNGSSENMLIEDRNTECTKSLFYSVSGNIGDNKTGEELPENALLKIIELNPRKMRLCKSCATRIEYKITGDILGNNVHSIRINSISELSHFFSRKFIKVGTERHELTMSTKTYVALRKKLGYLEV